MPAKGIVYSDEYICEYIYEYERSPRSNVSLAVKIATSRVIISPRIAFNPNI